MIAWRDEMAVGMDDIDSDHKVLIDIINDFEASLTRENAEATAKKLFLYSQSHFQREEDIQQRFNYPLRHEQMTEHHRIVRNLKSLIKDGFIDAKVDDAQIIAQLTKLMQDWIVGHVLHHDLKMRKFFATLGSARP